MKRLKTSLWAIAVAVVATGANGIDAVAAGSADGAMETVSQQTVAPEILNYRRVEGPAGIAGSQVALGGPPTADQVQQLGDQGFVTVVDLRTAEEEGADIDASRAAAEADGLNYIHLPFSPQNPDAALTEEFLAAVSSAENQPVYVHCRSGVRASALWMTLRVSGDGWEPAKARQEIETLTVNPEMAGQLAEKLLETNGS